MNLRVLKSVAAGLVVSIVGAQPAVYASSIPSKTARNQGTVERAVDMARARAAFATESISIALAAEGLTPAQINEKVAALSTEDLLSLAANPAQIRAAGITMSKRVWTVVGIAAGAVAVGAFALKNDDGEDEDGSDDGED